MPLGVSTPIPHDTTVCGFVSAYLTEADWFDDASLAATVVDPVFQGSIDGNSLPNSHLWNPGFSLHAPPGGNANDSISFSGLAGQTSLSQIGIRLTWVLSPGDSAILTGMFEIHAVPSPTGLSLFAIFGTSATKRRRRRRV